MHPHTILRDIALALRRARRDPWFAIVAAGVLALGVAAATAVFALVRGVALRPLPYPESERLVALVEDGSAPSARDWPTTVARLADFNTRADVFTGGLAGSRTLNAVLQGRDGAERLAGARVTGNLADVLGVTAQRGRWLAAPDAEASAAPVVVIADGLWRRAFGADPAIVGSAVILDGVARTVVGIAAPGFAWPRAETEFWVPFVPTPAESNRAWFALRTVGRLAPGTTPATATERLRAIAVALDSEFPDTDRAIRPRLVPLLDQILGPTRRTLRLLAGGALLLFIVASGNFANLLLARGATREGELAVRQALGARRTSWVRSQVTEGLLLGGLGAGLGLGLGWLTLRVALGWVGDALPRGEEVRIDGLVVGVAGLAALVAGVVGGGLPALWSRGSGLAGSLRGTAKGSASSRRQFLLAALMVLEVSAAVALAIGAGLLGRSMARVAAIESGIETAGLVTLEVGEPGPSPSLAAAAQYYRRLLEDVRATPGIDAVSAVSRLPVVGLAASTGYEIEGRPNPTGQSPVADQRYVEPGALPLMGVPIVAGRDIEATDTAETTAVVVVNRAFANLHFPAGDAVGRRLWIGNERARWRTIVGVVGDVHLAELERPVEPTLWFPFAQATFPGVLRSVAIIARSRMPAREALAQLEAAARRFDAQQAPTRPRSMTDALANARRPRELQARLIAAFAATALALAMAGIFAVTAFSVASRGDEFGVRLALGADGAALGRHVLLGSLRLGGLGLGLGCGIALAAGRLLEASLYGTRPWDPGILAGVGACTLIAVMAAALAPALRAARTPPARALRG